MQPQQPALAIYRRLLRFVRPYSLHIAGVMTLNLLATPIALLGPLPLKIVVDSAIGGRPLPGWMASLMPFSTDGSTGAALTVALLMLVGAALLNQLQAVTAWVLQTYTAERLLVELQSSLFAHVQRLSFTFHDRRGSADSVYRIRYDTQSVQNLAIYGIVPFMTSAFTLVAMIAVAARLDWTLALCAGAVVPPLFAMVAISRRRLRAHWSEIKESESSAMSVVQEVLGSLRVVKAFGQEDREQRRFVRQSTRTMRAQIRLSWTQGCFDVIVGLTLAAGMASALYLGALHVRAGLLSVGDLIVVMGYMTMFLAPVENIIRRLAQIQGAFEGAARAFALLDEKPDVVERPHARRIHRVAGSVSCRNVSFAYDPQTPVLHGVSFEVASGARVGIAGRTGAGKTTLVNLLARFYDPTDGQILLDGIDLRDYKLKDLRDQFAIVLQEPVLFSTSLADNIAYARPDASFEAIVEAAKAASAHDFIRALPDGYNTPVGERGFRLSGGERQRISLARAFLKDAPLLILDEPTSSVDVETEAAIMEAMERLMSGRTTFMIAHRLSTLERCDVRLVLEAGRVLSGAPQGLAIA
jgi:ATP-binding cassette subfamily B protein